MRKGLHIIRAMLPEVDVSPNQRCPLTDTHDREGQEYASMRTVSRIVGDNLARDRARLMRRIGARGGI